MSCVASLHRTGKEKGRQMFYFFIHELVDTNNGKC